MFCSCYGQDSFDACRISSPKASPWKVLAGAVAGGALGFEIFAKAPNYGLFRDLITEYHDYSGSARRGAFSWRGYCTKVDRANFWGNVKFLGLLSSSIALGGLIVAGLSDIKAKILLMKYNKELRAVLKITKSEIVGISVDDFPVYIEGKDKEEVVDSIDSLLEELSRNVVAIEVLMQKASEESGEWYDIFCKKSKHLLDAVSSIVVDLFAKKNSIP